YEIQLYPLWRLRAEPTSPAEMAGLKEGDEPIAVNGSPCTGAAPVLAAANEDPSVPLRVRVMRDGKPVDLVIPPRSREQGYYLGVLVPDVKISAVRNDAGREAIDLRAGDIVLSLDGEDVYSFRDVVAKWKSATVPFDASLRVRRAQGEVTVPIHFGSEARRTEILDSISTEPFENRFRVKEDSPAAAAGLQSGDRITAVGSTAVKTFSDLQAAMKSFAGHRTEKTEPGGAKVLITFEREGAEKTVEVTPRPLLIDDRGIAYQQVTVTRH